MSNQLKRKDSGPTIDKTDTETVENKKPKTSLSPEHEVQQPLFISKRYADNPSPLEVFLKQNHFINTFNNSMERSDETYSFVGNSEYNSYLDSRRNLHSRIINSLKKLGYDEKMPIKEILSSLRSNIDSYKALFSSEFFSLAALPKPFLPKNNWDLVLDSIQTQTKKFHAARKLKRANIAKLRRKIEAKKTTSEDTKIDKNHKIRLAKKISKIVQSKWDYIRNVLKLQRDINAAKKKAEESESKLFKILDQSTKALTTKSSSQLDSDSSSVSDYYSTYTSNSSSESEPSDSESSLKRIFKDFDKDSVDIADSEIKNEINNTSPQLDFQTNIEPDSSKILSHQIVPTYSDFIDNSPQRFTLLKYGLRSYQKSGVDWLLNQHNNGRNSILADEMGLGKTIQTISLLENLAVTKGIWGPHLIIVPTSVLLNWTQEFKKWLPGFKILTIYGSQKQRRIKRSGWMKKNAFHVCISTYQIVLADINAFKRQSWSYLVLDEAHNIKNFKSKRWQSLMTIKSSNRLLLTGTPLQNNLSELWSLLYFLLPQKDKGGSDGLDETPNLFAGLEEFQDWFSKPLDSLFDDHTGLEISSTGRVNLPAFSSSEPNGEDLNGSSRIKDAVNNLHTVLRPFILRRLKADVEQQLPKKSEYIIYCNLSRRQQYLYDDFISRSKTVDTLKTGNYMDVMSCLMQLRKVCNHPDLFEPRHVITPSKIPNVVDCLESNKLSLSKTYLYIMNLLKKSDHQGYIKKRDRDSDFIIEPVSTKLISSSRGVPFEISETGDVSFIDYVPRFGVFGKDSSHILRNSLVGNSYTGYCLNAHLSRIKYDASIQLESQALRKMESEKNLKFSTSNEEVSELFSGFEAVAGFQFNVSLSRHWGKDWQFLQKQNSIIW
ncbi:Helicase SWR1 [Smittium mucronatum]|uniref:Helicase SWR1 n=1 Tax=Smittium mucronatum TaxID=133383 RepID=A0A1R0H2D7_9FUNG|nr:Helicase SWR1 [Smittium mucronatum]